MENKERKTNKGTKEIHTELNKSIIQEISKERRKSKQKDIKKETHKVKQAGRETNKERKS